MDTDRTFQGGAEIVPGGLKHAELTQKIIGVFYVVYSELGHGFLESLYKEAMRQALTERGCEVATERAVPVWFKGRKIGEFRAGMLVNGCVLLEFKAVRVLDKAHEAQLLHYLCATGIEVGLLFNFGARLQFRRLLFDNQRKKIRENPCESVAEVLP